MPQDMPPTGGYAQVQYKRNLPARGFKPGYYMIGMHLIMAYGFYKYFHGVREQRYVLSATGSFPASDRAERTAIGISSCNGEGGTTLDLKADVCSDFSELAREKMWSRLHLTPLLQAEEDRDQVRRYYADKAREKELLGTDAKIYNSDRFVRPTFAYTPSKLTQ
ncbi:hypothetical protein N7535_007604 [Penicillium sp. DV-2018c]|nr:hypothetical protein N7461_003632 [Penicillium sp. DV-2018c]KAJ5565966.1 hypothetical protein N7535_007604 [Penicillium sp. DV-2018c]